MAHLVKAAERQKRHYDARAKIRPFLEGKEMPTPIAVSDIEDDKSATTSHPETEGVNEK